MPLNEREQIFGIHDIAAYDTKTRKPLGKAKIPGSASLNLSGEVIENTGGSSSYPWAVEDGLITPELNLTLKEYPNWLWEAFNGIAVTENAAELSGAVSKALENVSGSSVMDATTGIASAAVKSGAEADLKSGPYIVEAISATTVNIYALSDLDFGRGTVAEYVDESLKINASPLTITSGGATEIAGFGIELTGGSGTVAMTEGDTAIFEVRSANSKSESVTVGGSNANYKEIGLLLTAQKRSNGQLFMLDVFKAKAIGLPINMTAKEFSNSELTLKLFKDEFRNGVYKMDRIDTV